jgi:cytochrome c-type biogenesis protein CcmF
VAGRNYIARRGHFTAQRGNHISDLYPETRYFPVEEQKTTETAILNRWNGDLYIVIGDKQPDAEIYAVRLYWRPMMLGIWAGAALMALGGVLALFSMRRKP